jgi:hypothetical protein
MANSNIIVAQSSPRPASQLVEIPVTANGLGRVNIPDIQQLRSLSDLIVVLKAIRLIVPQVLTHAVTASGVNAPLAELQKITLVLYCEGWEKGYQIPLLTLNDMAGSDETSQAPHNYALTHFDDWQKVDWSKSYLQYANGQTSANAPYVVMLDVQYIRLNIDGTQVTGAR